jgi:hypothetical protein
MAGQVSALTGQGPAAYTPQMSAEQQQAIQSGMNLGMPAAYGQAGDTLNNVPNVQGQSVLDNLSSYYNPYESSVINPVLQQYDYQAGQTRAAQAAQAAAGGAFGGSRYGVQEANTEGQLAMGRASTQGGLLNQMYGQAAGMSAQDAANRQAAMLANQNAALQKGGLLTNLGAQEAQTQGRNVELQDTLGGQATELQNQQRQYPLQYQAQLESLLQGLNPALFTGQSTSGTGTENSTSSTVSNPGLLASIGQGLSIASSLFGGQGGGGGLSSMFGGGGGGGGGSQMMPEFY